ncbi:SOS response-associated peptidase [Cellulomonas sp. S1-8]|uniref:SOS response-associated peptidase n=1 Tax=Cellulomonas sp. S1-8 TaxID=2904790 RepID=UPI002243D500|nr:SOS response-associated peptidase [Cellulomonas sp. S1-8]UZN05272.1 SOS response-associated peptidase [Cellulomonas sp. S1-8]
MCGRYASFREDQAIADEFAVATVADDVRLLPPSWNVAPTDGVRMVVERADRATGEITRQLRVARWGLVPSWAKDPSIGSRMINARAETVAEKSAFARPLAMRRALLPADGYYEWQAAPEPPAGTPRSRRPAKQPYWIHLPDDEVAALAGLYEFWRDPSRDDDDPDRWLVSVTVVTRAATEAMAPIHDRQPVLLPPDAWSAWLDPAVGADDARALLAVTPPPLTATPVGTRVNSVANNTPDLIEPTRVDPPSPTGHPADRSVGDT